MPRRGYIDFTAQGSPVFFDFSGPVDELPQQCFRCSGFGDYLCDYQTGTRRRKDGTYKTCDRPLCRQCAHEFKGHDIHLCPEHYEAWVEEQKDGVIALPTRGRDEPGDPSYATIMHKLIDSPGLPREDLQSVAGEFIGGLARMDIPEGLKATIYRVIHLASSRTLEEIELTGKNGLGSPVPGSAPGLVRLLFEGGEVVTVPFATFAVYLASTRFSLAPHLQG